MMFEKQLAEMFRMQNPHAKMPKHVEAEDDSGIEKKKLNIMQDSSGKFIPV
jgi:hypothetical protein